MRSFRLIIALAIVIFSAPSMYAAPAPPTGGSDPGCWPPPCVPIDGGISFLIAAGAAYGAKKIYDSRKKKDQIS